MYFGKKVRPSYFKPNEHDWKAVFTSAQFNASFLVFVKDKETKVKNRIQPTDYGHVERVKKFLEVTSYDVMGKNESKGWVEKKKKIRISKLSSDFGVQVDLPPLLSILPVKEDKAA